MTSSSMPPPQKAAVSLLDGWVPSMCSQIGVFSLWAVCVDGMGELPFLP